MDRWIWPVHNVVSCDKFFDENVFNSLAAMPSKNPDVDKRRNYAVQLQTQACKITGVRDARQIVCIVHDG